MSFWKKLFGAKKSPNAAIADRQSIPPSANSQLLAGKPIAPLVEPQLSNFHRFVLSEPPDAAYLLTVKEPEVLPNDYRDANPTTEPSDAGPLGGRFYSADRSGVLSYYDRIREAKDRLRAAGLFSVMVKRAVLNLNAEDLDNLALNAKSEVVRAEAAKRKAELVRQYGGHD